MQKCPNCGHNVKSLPSRNEAIIEQILSGMQNAEQNRYLDAVRCNDELLDHIRALWDENQALKAQLVPAAVIASKLPES